jgi:hypothetical protein
MSQDQERVLGWDDEISNDDQSSFVLLPPGDYDFEVVDLKRGRHEPKGNGKLPPCPKATVTIRCATADGESDLEHNLFLHSRCEGMLCEFFRAIGQRRHGEPLRPDWSRVVGSRGRCKVAVREYTGRDGEKRQTNDIKRFYDPPAGGNGTAQPQSAGGF